MLRTDDGVSYRPLQFAMSENFKHVCQGKRVRAGRQLRRSRAIFTARRKLASGPAVGASWWFALCLSFASFACGQAGKGRNYCRWRCFVSGDGFLWGRKSNEFAEYEQSCLVFAYRQKLAADGRPIPALTRPFPRPPWQAARLCIPNCLVKAQQRYLPPNHIGLYNSAG